jgi:hypothetical protein
VRRDTAGIKLENSLHQLELMGVLLCGNTAHLCSGSSKIAPECELDLGSNLYPEAGEVANIPAPKPLDMTMQFDVHVKHCIAMPKIHTTNLLTAHGEPETEKGITRKIICLSQKNSKIKSTNASKLPVNI